MCQFSVLIESGIELQKVWERNKVLRAACVWEAEQSFSQNPESQFWLVLLKNEAETFLLKTMAAAMNIHIHIIFQFNRDRSFSDFELTAFKSILIFSGISSSALCNSSSGLHCHTVVSC